MWVEADRCDDSFGGFASSCDHKPECRKEAAIGSTVENVQISDGTIRAKTQVKMIQTIGTVMGAQRTPKYLSIYGSIATSFRVYELQ